MTARDFEPYLRRALAVGVPVFGDRNPTGSDLTAHLDGHCPHLRTRDTTPALETLLATYVAVPPPPGVFGAWQYCSYCAGDLTAALRTIADLLNVIALNDSASPFRALAGQNDVIATARATADPYDLGLAALLETALVSRERLRRWPEAPLDTLAFSYCRVGSLPPLYTEQLLLHEQVPGAFLHLISEPVAALLPPDQHSWNAITTFPAAISPAQLALVAALYGQSTRARSRLEAIAALDPDIEPLDDTQIALLSTTYDDEQDLGEQIEAVRAAAH